MRHALAVLVLLLSFAGPSFAQPAPSNQPHPDSTVVWFYLNEAHMLNDTLWSGVDRRRKFAVVWALYRNRDSELNKERLVSDSLAAQLKGFSLAVANCTDSQRFAEDELLLCKQRSKNKFWTGFGTGVGTLAILGLVTALLVQ
jgi:hypothetical protein